MTKSEPHRASPNIKTTTCLGKAGFAGTTIPQNFHIKIDVRRVRCIRQSRNPDKAHLTIGVSHSFSITTDPGAGIPIVISGPETQFQREEPPAWRNTGQERAAAFAAFMEGIPGKFAGALWSVGTVEVR